MSWRTARAGYTRRRTRGVLLPASMKLLGERKVTSVKPPADATRLGGRRLLGE